MKIPRIILFVLSFILFISNYSIGQHAPIDSLTNLLHKDIDTKKRVNVLNEIVKLNLHDPDSMIWSYIKEAIKLSRDNEYESELGDSNHLLGELLINQGSYDSALKIHLSNLELRQKLGVKQKLADTYHSIGVINEYLGNYSDALNFQIKTLEIRELLEDNIGVSNCYNSIAIIHSYQNNNEKAIEYFKKSLELRKVIGDENEIANSFNNLGIMYRAIGQHEIARDYYTKSLKTKEKLNDRKGISNSLNNIGITYFYELNYPKALEYYLKSLEIRKNDSNKGYLASSYLNIGEVYVKLSQFEQAEDYLNKAQQFASETGNRDDLRLTYLILSELYKKKTSYKQALEYIELYSALNDSIYSQQQNEAIAEMQTKYEVEKKEKEIAILQKDKEITAIETEQHVLIRNISIIGFLVIAYFIVAIFRSYRKDIEKAKLLKQHRLEIEHQNQSLLELNYEKDQLMKIVAHDMRSPLNQIDGLVTLINFEADQLSEQQKVSLEKITETTAHSKELLSKILNSKSLDPKQLPLKLENIALNPIVQSITSDFALQAKAKNIGIELEMPTESMEALIDKNYAEQIVENLISNAVKFSPFDKKIFVSLSEVNESVRIEIQDQGPGVNKDDMKKLFGKYQKLSAEPTGGEITTGLGLSIVKKYVQAMNGKVWCESDGTEGAKFIVEFKKA